MAAGIQAVALHRGAALNFVQVYLGYLINEVESFPTLNTGNPTAPFLAGNADRVGLLFCNFGNNLVQLSTNPSVLTSGGILLNSNGGIISMNVRDDFTLPARAWWGAATSVAQAIYVLELIAAAPLPAVTP